MEEANPEHLRTRLNAVYHIATSVGMASLGICRTSTALVKTLSVEPGEAAQEE
jgi:hypothetical protein